MSWQEALSEQALDELDRLGKAALPFARQQLDNHGEFYPFGVAMSASGDIHMVAADPSQGDRPASSLVIAANVEALREHRDEYRAIALVSDVRIPDGDAVRVELEHREGAATAILLPYSKKRFGRRIEYGNLRGGSAAALQIWNA